MLASENLYLKIYAPWLASTHNQTVILNPRAVATPFSVIHFSEHYASECFARLFEVILVSSRKMRLVGAILVYFCTLHTLVTGRFITQSPLFQPKNSKDTNKLNFDQFPR